MRRARFLCHAGLVLLLVLTGCASAPAPWPADLPPRVVFLAAWEADVPNQALQTRDDYLLWVERFYTGYNLAPGWLDVTRETLALIQEAERPDVAQRLGGLGTRIAAEWAKDNSVRRIATRHAAVWRDALVEAIAQADLLAYLARVEADVTALLGGELDPDAVVFERYYVDEFDF